MPFNTWRWWLSRQREPESNDTDFTVRAPFFRRRWSARILGGVFGNLVNRCLSSATITLRCDRCRNPAIAARPWNDGSSSISTLALPACALPSCAIAGSPFRKAAEDVRSDLETGKCLPERGGALDRDQRPT
jgi:methionyl-tRNA synthetase